MPLPIAPTNMKHLGINMKNVEDISIKKYKILLGYISKNLNKQSKILFKDSIFLRYINKCKHDLCNIQHNPKEKFQLDIFLVEIDSKIYYENTKISQNSFLKAEQR